MKTSFALLFAAALLVTGCTADDLVGPAATSASPSLAMADEFAPAASLTGAWVATDALGIVRITLDYAPSLSTNGSAHALIKGQAELKGSGVKSVVAKLEGQIEKDAIAFMLLNKEGETIAKALGSVAHDFSGFKVLFIEGDDRHRELHFTRP